MSGLGVYIHIPFCLRKCNYCDFCSFTNGEDNIFADYTNELCRRIKEFSSARNKRESVSTIYFGGGTPTLLPAKQYSKLLKALHEAFDIVSDAEISVECNPASIDLEGLQSLYQIGINRLSIGLQSTNDNELKILGRLHDFNDFCECFDSARMAGFDNISVDIMYGIPEQTEQSLYVTLQKVCELSPEHISAYCLKIEDGTAFARCESELKLPDEDTEYKMYCMCADVLAEHGYERYEISNFSKKGKESKHNLRYWQLEDYIGFGVAAHSCTDGERYGNSRDIDAFLRGEDITEERYIVSSDEQLREYVMLSLRLEKGLDMTEYKRRCGREFKSDFPKVNDFVSGGFMRLNGSHLAFTQKGFFVSNAILCEMLY